MFSLKNQFLIQIYQFKIFNLIFLKIKFFHPSKRTILENNFIEFSIRDVYLNDKYKDELLERINGQLVLPALFVDGEYQGVFFYDNFD